MVFSILTTANLFKVPVQLRINKSSFLSSRPGEILSLVIYIYLLYNLIKSDVFAKKKPQILQTEVETLTTATFNFTPDNFALMVGIASLSNFSIELDPKYATFYAEYFVMSLNPMTKNYDIASFQKLVMPKCRDSPVGRQHPDLLKQYPTTFCLPNTTFSVFGSYAEPTYQFMEVTLEMCNNNTMNNSCQSQAEIDEFIQGKFFGFVQTDNLFTGDDHEHPFQTKMTSKFISLDSKIRKMYKANLQTMTVVDDDGVVQSNSKSKETWKIGSADFDIDLNSHIQLASLLYMPTNKGVIISRNYMKLQEELGSLGGIANIFMGIGLLLMKMSPFGVLQLFLSKHLFSFQSLGKNTQKLLKKKLTKKQKQKMNVPLSKNMTIEVQDTEKALKEENQNLPTSIGKIKSIVLEDPPKLHHKNYSDIEAYKLHSILINSPINSPKSLVSRKTHKKKLTSILMSQDLFQPKDDKDMASNKLKPLSGDDPLEQVSIISQPKVVLKRMQESCLLKLKSSNVSVNKKRKSVTQEVSFANNFMNFSNR